MNLRQVESVQEAKQDSAYLKALKSLLYQMADDDLIFSHRGSEWLGLVPHIEEDVAYSSITQNTLGHALIFYNFLEELGEGKADDLAYLRKPDEYKHALLLERPNGEGHYADQPNFDWGYAIMRNLAYETFKRLRLHFVTQSTYKPLAVVAQKMLREQFYHLQHWQVWVFQLGGATEEATNRLNKALEKVWMDADSLFDLGPDKELIVEHGLMNASDRLKEEWVNSMRKIVEQAGLKWPGELPKVEYSGRDGVHSQDFVIALSQISEVYQMDPSASW